jgi:Protein of unknown function (DUF3685)
MRSSSLQQIEAALSALNTQLQSSQISAVERAVLNGRRRELIAARWLVQRLFSGTKSPNLIPPESPDLPTEIELVTPGKITAKQLQSDVFDRLAAKLQSNLDNLTTTPLEIDILRVEKKRELFYLVLRQIEGLLDELRFSQISVEQLSADPWEIWQDLWESITMDFFGRYHTLSIGDRQIELIPALLQDRSIVQTEILIKIIQPIELLNYLLFQVPLPIDNTTDPINSQIATARAGELLEHLTIIMATAVIWPLLNRFGNLESIKSTFYDRRLLSSREIERFRNDLSWRYRIDRYFIQPQAIFENRYRLFIFSNYGIEQMAIYAPRPEELDGLAGIPLAVTLALETRDAIAPRLRSATTFLGTIIVYLLTEIIGRSIGLIGRGIIKGVGNIWQETHRSRRE